MTTPLRETLVERAFRGYTSLVRGQGGFLWMTLGAVAFGVAALEELGWSIWVGVASTVIGVVTQLRLRPSYSELSARAAEAAAQSGDAAKALQRALRSILRRTAAHCGINETHQRITIYCNVEDEFVMLARHSESPRLAAGGRGIYPAGQGVIGDAWDKGESLRRDWPADRLEWNALQSKLYNMTPAAVAALTMQARSMVALRLTYEGRHVGVLVMESTEGRGVKRTHLTRARESLLIESMSEILASAQPQLPEVVDYLKRKS